MVALGEALDALIAEAVTLGVSYANDILTGPDGSSAKHNAATTRKKRAIVERVRRLVASERKRCSR